MIEVEHILGTLGINEVSVSVISIAPNPTDGIFNINTGNSIIRNVTIRDIHGRIIRKLNGNETNKMTLDISDVNSALYFIAVETENGYKSIKVVKK